MGELLALADLGGRDPAIWRAIARRVAWVVGCGDLARGCAGMLGDAARKDLWAVLRLSLGSAIREREERDGRQERIEETVDDLLRALRRELMCVCTEVTLGLRRAALLRPFRQEAVCRLPLPVRQAMRGILEGRDRPVDDQNDFDRLIAAAWSKARDGAEPSPAKGPDGKPLSFLRILDGIPRLLDQVNHLLDILRIPLRAVLVPRELAPFPAETPRREGDSRRRDPLPTHHVPDPTATGLDADANTTRSTSQGVAGPDSSPARGELRWIQRLRRLAQDAIPLLTPALQEYLIVPS